MTELEQVQRFIQQSQSFPGLRQTLERYAETLAPVSVVIEPPGPPVAAAVIAPSNTAPTAARSAPRTVATKGFIPIESFSWDQGEYNSPTVTVYVDLEGVGTVKDSVTCDFGTASFDLKV